jgi:DNA polymerase elongation subunit (family B)
MENGIPDIDKPNNEITSIALYDPTVDKYVAFVLDKNRLYDNRDNDNVEVVFCDNETNLLLKFMDYYEMMQPTIITGWNSDGFDIPYLINRVRQICGPHVVSRFSPIGQVKYNPRKEKYVIAGVSCLDYMMLYKKFTYTEQQNYRLDTIGRVEVGMGKVEYEGSLDDLFAEDLETFIDYNLTDVKIIVELDKKLQFIELVRGICHVGHVPYEVFWHSSRFLEGTIITYLHRKGIIVTNKPADGQAMMNQRGDDEGFEGAFVKEPIPGLYDWVYSLDLQSLYPSIIMSLNISPETKIGFVRNWNVEQHSKKEIKKYVIEEVSNAGYTFELEPDEFNSFMEDNKLSISSNGVLYDNSKMGIIPEVLDVWFKQRVEFKDLMKKYTNEGNNEKASYYDRRQHIQKIFLNSLYGTLGLPVFRFYDVDNASAVTLTGQDVIKTSTKFVNLKYKKATGKDEDFCVYVDTDSLYYPALPVIEGNNIMEETIQLARETEDQLNSFYDLMAKKMFNCDSHRFYIKGEVIASTGFWVAKKRYAMQKVYDLETNQTVDKVAVKGLDVVRSSFPQAFREFMTEILGDILGKTEKDIVDDKILTFKGSLKDRNYMEVARNTSANGMTKYFVDADEAYKSRTPAHIKACITYNRLLDKFNLGARYEKITDGMKVKYVYLKDNPHKVPSIAVKAYNDPPQIIELVENFVDYDASFEKELRNKLHDFYTALDWGNIPTEVNQNASDFFAF